MQSESAAVEDDGIRKANSFGKQVAADALDGLETDTLQCADSERSRKNAVSEAIGDRAVSVRETRSQLYFKIGVAMQRERVRTPRSGWLVSRSGGGGVKYWFLAVFGCVVDGSD